MLNMGNHVFTIGSPWMLPLLLLPILYLYYYLKWGRQKVSTVSFPEVSLVKKAQNHRIDYLRIIPALLRIAIITLVILGLIRFQHGTVNRETVFRGTDIIICLDTSPSMRALDFRPKNRITVAKEVVQDFIRGRMHDRIGMVVFAGSNVTVCPLTSDYSALLWYLDQVHEGITQTDGTAIGDALATSINRLKGSNARSKIIILVTDGRSNMGMIDPLSAAKLAKTLGVKIYAIGVGKKGPAPMPDPLTGMITGYIYDDLNEESLQEIARTTSGIYERATDQESLTTIFKKIDKLEKTEYKTKIHVDYREFYPWFLWSALVVLIFQIILEGTVYRRIP